MGVSGSGKSLIGAALARALRIDFVEGDAYHSAENVKRMTSGVPLTDEDRAQWLQSLAARILEAKAAAECARKSPPPAPKGRPRWALRWSGWPESNRLGGPAIVRSRPVPAMSLGLCVDRPGFFRI